MAEQKPAVEQVVKALRWLAKETEFVFAAEQLNAAATLIESQAAEIARLTEYRMANEQATISRLVSEKNALQLCKDKLVEQNRRLIQNLAESQRRERAAVSDSALRKGMELTPIYTCGGHGGYYDDDDEDFWCPICHAHLGTHRGFKTTCPRCGQSVNHDSEPLHNYRDMRKSEADWRGPQEAL